MSDGRACRRTCRCRPRGPTRRPSPSLWFRRASRALCADRPGRKPYEQSENRARTRPRAPSPPLAAGPCLPAWGCRWVVSLPIPLGDVYPPHGWRTVRPRLRAVEQRLQVLIELRLVLRRQSAHPRPPRLLARASIGFLHPVRCRCVATARSVTHPRRLPSPISLSVGVSLRSAGARYLHHLSFQRFSVSRRLPSLHGVPRVGSPDFIGTTKRSDCPSSSRRAPFPRSRYRCSPCSLRRDSESASGGLVLVRDDLRALRRKRQALPGSWGTLVNAPRSQTPVGRHVSRHSDAGRCCRLVFPERHRPHEVQIFRGSIARPAPRCLRFAAGSPRSTQDSLRLLATLWSDGTSPAGL